MKRLFIQLIFALFIFNSIYAQKNDKKNIYHIFIEGGGQGLASINYEQSIYEKFTCRIGYGIMLPFLVNYYFGDEYQFEIGLGLSYSPYKILKVSEKEKLLFYSITIGHKYKPLNNGMTLRFSFTPLYNPNNNRIQIMGGISIGITY